MKHGKRSWMSEDEHASVSAAEMAKKNFRDLMKLNRLAWGGEDANTKQFSFSKLGAGNLVGNVSNLLDNPRLLAEQGTLNLIRKWMEAEEKGGHQITQILKGVKYKGQDASTELLKAMRKVLGSSGVQSVQEGIDFVSKRGF
jgi:hypothetical protein